MKVSVNFSLQKSTSLSCASTAVPSVHDVPPVAGPVRQKESHKLDICLPFAASQQQKIYEKFNLIAQLHMFHMLCVCVCMSVCVLWLLLLLLLVHPLQLLLRQLLFWPTPTTPTRPTRAKRSRASAIDHVRLCQRHTHTPSHTHTQRERVA